MSLALLVVLETLSPAERAVFVLREVFGMSVAEVAGALNRSEAAVRQMAHRAREHVHARQPRFDTDPREQREVTERFLAAAVTGDVESLLAALAPDVVLIADGGGKVTAARRPIVGADKVARFLVAVAARRGATSPVCGSRSRRSTARPRSSRWTEARSRSWPSSSCWRTGWSSRSCSSPTPTSWPAWRCPDRSTRLGR